MFLLYIIDYMCMPYSVHLVITSCRFGNGKTKAAKDTCALAGPAG